MSRKQTKKRNKISKEVLTKEPHSKLTHWGSIASIIGVFLAIYFGLIPILSSNNKNIVDINNSSGNTVLQDTGDVTINNNFIYETSKDLTEAKNEVTVLESHIVDASKGYMKIKIANDFLNSKFDIPITLKYKFGRYEPVTLTFKNHPTKGPGIIISSPEHEKNVSVFLNDFINVGNAHKIYTKDFIFNLYYNESKVFLYAESGEVSYVNNSDSTSSEPFNMPIKYIVFTGYFNEDSKSITVGTPPELGELIKYFQTYKSSN